MNGPIWQEDFYKVIWKLQHLGVCGSAWGTRSPLQTPLYSSSRQRESVESLGSFVMGQIWRPHPSHLPPILQVSTSGHTKLQRCWEIQPCGQKERESDLVKKLASLWHSVIPTLLMRKLKHKWVKWYRKTPANRWWARIWTQESDSSMVLPLLRMSKMRQGKITCLLPVAKMQQTLEWCFLTPWNWSHSGWVHDTLTSAALFLNISGAQGSVFQSQRAF